MLRQKGTTKVTTDSVRLPVMHFLYRFTPETIVAGASMSNGKISMVIRNGGYSPGFGPAHHGSTFPVEYIVDRYDKHGKVDPLYPALGRTLTNEEYSDEMKILRLRMLKQKGDA